MTRSILQVVTDTDRRGAQVFAVDLQGALERLGHDVQTVALAEGLVGGLDLPVLGRGRRSPSTFSGLRRRARAFDVVIAHGSTTLPLCAISLLGTDVPFVYRQISDVRFWARSRPRQLRVASALRRASRVVALWEGSAQVVRDHLGVPAEKIAVVPNGVPTEGFRPVSDDVRRDARERIGLRPEQPTVICAGALVPEKGVDLVVDALASVPAAQLVIVGDGPERAALERRGEAKLAGRLAFLGNLDTVADAYAAGDLVALASRGGDSMPAVLIEAGLMGLPVVATPIEAIPEIVLDGRTGAIVPVDDLPALTAALVRLLDDADGSALLGAAAREHCMETFSIDVVAKGWAQVVEAAARR
jgi:glycosyltransferase involved in cell wall biosynthesis